MSDFKTAYTPSQYGELKEYLKIAGRLNKITEKKLEVIWKNCQESLEDILNGVTETSVKQNLFIQKMYLCALLQGYCMVQNGGEYLRLGFATNKALEAEVRSLPFRR